MAVVCTTRRIEGIISIVGGGDLSADRQLTLINDVNRPGPSKYYGTNSESVKGWHDLPNAALTSLLNRIIAIELVLARDNVTWFFASSDYSVAEGVNHVKCTAIGITVTMPNASSVRKITVKNQTDGEVFVTSASLIDSTNTWILAGREAGQFVADGTIWNIT